ncbi:MAG: single-stranded-DNA-specific exonuclease RecJ [Deltaproteobacteria bacterium]|nr:single-stranded-DNA-specific exonuclease RecJ [Deltaproteobacteria bacterium]
MRWNVLNPEPDARWDPKEWGVSPLTIQILQNRGITDPDQAKQFLAPALSELPDPFLMKGAKAAAIRILSAIRRQEKIILFGDYDVDGTTAIALLLLFLRETGAQVDFYLPHRLKEGYGLNQKAVEKIKAQGAKLLITADCGVSNFEEIRWAQENGLDVIITDHHEIPKVLPPALTILNPKQNDCSYPFKDLAGVGVAFNLIIGLRRLLREEGIWNNGNIPNLKGYLDLVALGTVSDVVPLTGVNRIIAKHGLKELARSSRAGILALKEIGGLTNAAVDTTAVNFRFAPRMNAAGRLDDASVVVRMLTAREPREAQQIASHLNDLNFQRQRIEEKILFEAREMIRGSEDLQRRKTFVLASPDWHPGVIGIVASRLTEEFNRPAILIALKGKMGKGSGRSIPSFPLYQAIKSCELWMERFGGHEQAVGLAISEEAIPGFSRAFEEFADSALSPELLIPSLTLDTVVHLEQMSESFLSELDSLAPFGMSNPEPIIGINDLTVVDSKLVGRDHLRLRVQEGQIVRDAIGFRMASLHPLNRQRVNLALSPQVNLFQGKRTLQLKILDLQAAG